MNMQGCSNHDSVPAGRWLVFATLLGLALRCFVFLRGPEVWQDEAVLLLNVIDKDYRALLGPLDWAEAAPPLFLWLERTIYLLVGDHLYALRAPAFLASCATIVLFASLVRRVLPAKGAIVAVGLMSISDSLLAHTWEAKPYAIDVLLATFLLLVHVKTSTWTVERQALVHMGLAPWAIFLSYPGTFLCGGSLVALWPAVSRARRATAWLAYAAWVAIVAGSFLLLVLGPARAQRCELMESCWTRHFPDWSKPWLAPWWSVAGAFEVGRYCFKPMGQAVMVIAAVVAARMWRVGRRKLVVLALAPLGLALVAAWMHRYPFGGSRLEVFAAPGLALLVGYAGGVLESTRARFVALMLAVAIGIASMIWTAVDLGGRGPHPRSAAAIAFVRRHATEHDMIAGNKFEHLYSLSGSPSQVRLLYNAAIRHPERIPLVPDGALVVDRRCWVVYTRTPADGALDIRRVSASSFRVVHEATFSDSTVYLLEPIAGENAGGD